MKGLFRVKVPYSPQRSEGGGSGLRGQRQTGVCFQDGAAKLLGLQAPACSLASSTRCFRKEMVHSVFIQNMSLGYCEEGRSETWGSVGARDSGQKAG